jgi:hypothetical protein
MRKASGRSTFTFNSVYGHRWKAWELKSQAFLHNQDGRSFDVITIVFPDGSSLDTWFDFTAFCDDFKLGEDDDAEIFSTP